MKKIIRHSLNYVDSPRNDGEFNPDPSETVPDMSYTVQEMMVRFANGRPLPKSRNLQYHGDDYYPDTRQMDMVEVEDMREASSKVITDSQAIIDEIRKKRKRKRKELPVPPELKDGGVERSDETTE